MERITEIDHSKIIQTLRDVLVSQGKLPQTIIKDIELIEKAKHDYDSDKLTKSTLSRATKAGVGLQKYLVDYIQRSRGIELERAKVKIKHGDKFGEVILLENNGYVIYDIDSKDTKIEVARINSDGSLGTLKPSSYDDFQKELNKVKFPQRVFIKEPLFENLKEIFGKHVEIQVGF